MGLAQQVVEEEQQQQELGGYIPAFPRIPPTISITQARAWEIPGAVQFCEEEEDAYDCVCYLVLGSLKVEVVGQFFVAAFFSEMKGYHHIELSPALFLQFKRRLLEILSLATILQETCYFVSVSRRRDVACT
jgi:hypothetical protein